MYVCMYVCMCVCMYTCLCIHMCILCVIRGIKGVWLKVTSQVWELDLQHTDNQVIRLARKRGRVLMTGDKGWQ